MSYLDSNIISILLPDPFMVYYWSENLTVPSTNSVIASPSVDIICTEKNKEEI